MSKNPQLIEVCDFIVDCEHKTAPTQETGYPSIRTPNIGRGRLVLDGVKRVSEDTYREWTRRAEPKPGDLILAREAPVGNVAIIPERLKVCLGQRTVLIRPNPKAVDGRFLNYLLLGRDVQSHIHSLTNGATVHHLNVKDIKQLPLPYFPDLSTQRQIADTLSAYDDLIENNTRRIAILEEMAQRLYREWFVHFRYPGHESVPLVESELGLIPEGWEVSSLGNLITLQRGFDLPKSERSKGEVPVVASTGLAGTHGTAKVSGPGVTTGRSGSLGTVLFLGEDFWPLNTTLWVRDFGASNPVHTYYLLQQIDLASLNSGAAVPTLDRKNVHRALINRPPKLLMSLFESTMRSNLDLRRKLTQLNDVLRKCRDTIMSICFQNA